MRKNSNFFTQNKLNINLLSLISSIVFITTIIIFSLFLIYLKKQGKGLSEIFSISSDFITIISCIFVVIQLIAFVNDSKLHENRARKEAALDLAKGYADDLLIKMTFIQNVLVFSYKSTNHAKPDLLELINSLDISSFLKEDLLKNNNLLAYSDYFKNGVSNINYEIILDQAMKYDLAMFDNIRQANSKDMKSLANIKFRILVSETLNLLEYYAMSINQNVAESDMLFGSLHQTFLLFVKYTHPYICMWNEKEEKFYPNVIKLYRIWTQKKEDYEQSKKMIEAKAKEKIKKQSHPGIPL